MRSTESISWTVKFRNGTIKRFQFPIRTTPEGSIKPFEGMPEGENLDNSCLFNEKEVVAPKGAMKKKVDVEDPDKTHQIIAHSN